MQENGGASPGRFGRGLSGGSGGAASGWGMNGPGSNGWFRSLEMEYVQIVVHERGAPVPFKPWRFGRCPV